MSDSVFPAKDIATREGQNSIAEAILELGEKLSPINKLAQCEQYAVNSATSAYMAKRDRERSEGAAQYSTLVASDVTEIKDDLLHLYNEGISNGNVVAPVIDSTLSLSGKAADAKSVGSLYSFLLKRINDFVINRSNRIDCNSPYNVEGKIFVNYYYDDESFTVSDWIYIGDLKKFYVSFVSVVSWGDKDRNPMFFNEIDGWSLQKTELTVPSNAEYVKVTYPTSHKEKAKLGVDFGDILETIPYNEFSLDGLYLKSSNFTKAITSQEFNSITINPYGSARVGVLEFSPLLYSIFTSDGENTMINIDNNNYVWVRNLSDMSITVDVRVNYIHL